MTNYTDQRDGPCPRCTELQQQVDALRALRDEIGQDMAYGTRRIYDRLNALLTDPAPANPLPERVKQLEAGLAKAKDAMWQARGALERAVNAEINIGPATKAYDALQDACITARALLQGADDAK